MEPQLVPLRPPQLQSSLWKQEMTVTLAYHSSHLWTLTHGSGKPSAGSPDLAMLPIKALLQNLGQLAPKPAKASFQARLGCLPTADIPSWIHVRCNFWSPLPQRQKQRGSLYGGDSEQRSHHVPQNRVSDGISPLVLEWQTRHSLGR